jgi:ankyrin repeat protein
MKLTAAFVVGLLTFAAFGGRLVSQSPAKIDFARDVQPLIQERCVGCHGPSLQHAGYRLDRRSAAMGGVTRPNIIPGSGESSRLYQRVLRASLSGPQMPPTGELTSDQIGIVKRWIDEGAEWPDALANEVDRPAESPQATRLAEAIRLSDRTAALDQLRRDSSIANGRGPGGATPLMYASGYGDAGMLAEMLKAGGDPDVRNDVGATALMWAIDDVDKVRQLLDRGADANATSDFGRTPLTQAAALAGSAPIVTLLLKAGAKGTPAALIAAVAAGDVAVVRLLLAAGVRDSGVATVAALRFRCRECLEAIREVQQVPRLLDAILGVLPPAGRGDPDALREAVERGGNVNAKDLRSRTVLMLAAISETVTPETMQLLIDQGADVHVTTPEGRTALDFANRLGPTPIVDVLARAGATATAEPAASLTFVKGNNVRDAVQRSLPLLQRAAVQFHRKSGCVSCHHNSLTAMTVAVTRPKGFTLDEISARTEVATIVKDINATHEQTLQGMFVNGAATTTGYVLMGLSAEGHPPDAATDALVRLLELSQRADGHWRVAFRPPSEASEITATALSLRGIQLYGRGQRGVRQQQVIKAATSWLEQTRVHTTEDRVFRLLGLTWARASATIRQSALQDLLAAQRTDGGWSQLPSLGSDAYATGSALVALHEAGIRPDAPAYRKGVQFLLATQLPDGSWFVRTRSHPTQVYFESGFPHGEHQFISAAATNWATQALAYAADRTP